MLKATRATSIGALARCYILAREAATKAKGERYLVFRETEEQLDCAEHTLKHCVYPSDRPADPPHSTCKDVIEQHHGYCPACEKRRKATHAVWAAGNAQGGALRALRHAVLSEAPEEFEAIKARSAKMKRERQEAFDKSMGADDEDAIAF